MRYVRLYTAADGESCFEDVDVPLAPGSGASHLSAPFAASGLRFGRAAPGSARGFHNAPRRQFAITLAGGVEFGASSGEARRFEVGSVLLVEDMTGKGHVARCVGSGEWRVLLLSTGDVSPPSAVPSASATYVRLYPGHDGESHFEEVSVPIYPGVGIVEPSAVIPVVEVTFRRSPPDYHLDWHHAPRRQFVVTLSGAVEIVASDGETRRLGPGSVMLAEDTVGRGHISRAAVAAERLSLFVPLPG